MATDPQGTTTYRWLVEQYVPNAGTEELRRRVARLRATVSSMDPDGELLRIVTATILPGDETVLCVVEAPTEVLVREIGQRGEVPFDRISPALPDTSEPPEGEAMRIHVLVAILAVASVVAAAPVAAATPEAVSLNVHVVLSGNLEASTTVGTFSSTGAVEDIGVESGSGWFAGLGHLKTGEPNSLHSTMTLSGSGGTITINLVGQFGQLPAPLAAGAGTWVVADGTGAYAHLHGRGSWTATADFRAAIARTGPPTVDFQLTGSTN